MSRKYKVTDVDRAATFATANRLGLDPYEFGAVLDKESGINPNIWGGDGGNYYGAIQFGNYERSEAGLDPKKIGNYTLAEQMPHIEKWVLGRGFKPGMGVDKLYATILGGNPDADMNLPDSNETTVNNSLRGLMRGGKNYNYAMQVLGPAPEGALLSNSAFEQTPTQTAAQALTTITLPDGTTISVGPNGVDARPSETKKDNPQDFVSRFLTEQIYSGMLQGDENKSVVDGLIEQAQGGGYISAKKAMELFGGFD